MWRALTPLLSLTTALVFSPPNAPAASPHRFTVVLADGRQEEGELVSIGEQWTLELQTNDGQTLKLPGVDLVRAFRDGSPPGPPAGPQVILATGDRIRGVLTHVDEEKLQLRSETAGVVTIPLECVLGVLLNVPSDESVSAELARAVQEATPDADELWLVNGDRLRGTIVQVGREVVLDRDGTELTVPTSQVRAIVLNRELISCPPPDTLHAVAVLDDGSELRLAQGQVRGRVLLATTSYGTEVSVPLDRLQLLEFLGGRVQYLSAMEPMLYEHVPFLGQTRIPWQRDRAVTGTPLMLRGQRFRRGVGVTTRCRLTYRLNGQYSRFHAVVGVDDQAKGLGSVVFVVRVDGKERFRSPVLTGRSSPVPVSVAVEGATELELVTEYAQQGDVLDYADWADAYVVRSASVDGELSSGRLGSP